MRTLNPTYTALAALCLCLGSSACRSSLDTEQPSSEPSWRIDAEDEPVTGDVPITGEPSTPIPDPAPIEEPMPGPPTLATCDIEQLWWDETPTHNLQARMFGWAPDLSAVIQGQSDYNSWSVRRARDGAFMYNDQAGQLTLDIDETWSRELVMDYATNEVRVATRDTHRVLWSDSVDHGTDVVMSADGTHVGLFECTTDSSGQPSNRRLSIHEVATGREVARSSTTSSYCDYWLNYSNYIAISPDGSVTAVVYRELVSTGDDSEDDVHTIVELISAQGARRVAYKETELLAVQDRYHGYVAELAFHPDGQSLSVIDGEGNHITIDVSSGEVHDQIKRGAFISNWNTYLPPLPQSPLAWSPDASIVASVTIDGEVELGSIDAPGEPIASIAPPELSDMTRRSFPQDILNAPTSIAISPGNDMVLVAFAQGIGVWGCAGALPEQETSSLSEINVAIPSTVSTSTHTPFTLSYMQRVPTMMLGIKVFLDGELHQSFSGDDTLELYLYREGTFDIVIEVDDGLDVIRSEPQPVTVARAM